MTAVDPTTRRGPRPWYIATLGGMASYLDGATIVTAGVTVSGGMFTDALHLGAWAIGGLSAALTFSFATGAIVGGRLGDVLGRRRVYSLDLLVYAVGVLLVILAPGVPLLFAGIVITGLAMGADVPTSLALVAEEAPRGRQGAAVAFSQTLWLVGVGIVQLISFFVGGLGIAGARVLWAHLLVVAIIVWFARRGVVESAAWRSSRSDPTAVTRRSLAAVFRKPYAGALAATGLYFLITGILPNTIGQFGPYLITGLGHSTISVFSLIGLGTLVGGLVIAALYQTLVDGTRARRVFLVVGLVTLVVGPIVPVLGGFSLLSLILLWIANTIGGTWAGEGMYKVWSQEIFPTEMRSSAQGFTYGIARYSMAVVGLFIPVLVNTQPSVVFIGLAVLGAIGALIGLVWLPRLPRHGREDVPSAAVATPSAVQPGAGLLAGEGGLRP